jgi:MFS family permease
MSGSAASGPKVPPATALYLALLQLLFTLCWTVYAIYLPALAASVGIAAGTVILILMLDQAIFTVCDTATGIAADRILRVIGRIGRWVAIITVISCATFLALPFITKAGPQAQALFLAATIVWAVTSSALRAPPIMLLGKYAARPQWPMLSAIVMLGYGVAGAAAPYLAVTLRGLDPRIPFVLSSAALLLATFGLAHVERRLARAPQAAPEPATARPALAPSRVSAARIAFAVAMIVLALGFQVHFAINTAPLFRRFTGELDWLMPLFWVGFNIAMFPATLLVKRWGAFAVMGVFGIAGALAILAAELASALNLLIVAQLLAGGAWGCILMSAFTAAFSTGENGNQGKMVGLLFSALAFAAFLRIGLISAGWHRDPDLLAVLQWAPVACWMIAGTLLTALALNWARREMTGAA